MCTRTCGPSGSAAAARPQQCGASGQHGPEQADRQAGRRVAAVALTRVDAGAVRPVMVGVRHVLTLVAHVARTAHPRRADDACGT